MSEGSRTESVIIIIAPPFPQALASSVPPTSVPPRPAGSLSATPSTPKPPFHVAFYSSCEKLAEEARLTPTSIMRVKTDDGDEALFYLCERLKVLTWHPGSLKLNLNKKKDSSAAISRPHSGKQSTSAWNNRSEVFRSSL